MQAVRSKVVMGAQCGGEILLMHTECTVLALTGSCTHADDGDV